MDHRLAGGPKVALQGGGVELKAGSLVEVQILASYSCSEAEDLPEKQHIDNFLEDLYFLIRTTVAELMLSRSCEPNGLMVTQWADSQGSGCTASLKALARSLQQESYRQMI